MCTQYIYTYAIMLCRMFGRIAIWLVLTVALANLSMAVPQELPEGEGKKLLEERCVSCHSLNPVVNLKQNRDAWKKLVVKMVGYGAQLDDKTGGCCNRVSDEALRAREFDCGRKAG